ncbi:excinuclease ABC subunit A, partial [mine drainage metagenome]
MRQKHSIEAVVDRFRPKPELAQRLAESFETALRLGEGLALVIDMDAWQESPSAASAGRAGAVDAAATPQIFSSRYSCPLCDYSLPELEPRLFSFNSPVGACPRCDGLGTTEFFDPARVVLHPELSLAGGAVRGWDRRNP